eukprot:gnl/TRDRNA2_/TRDRNA2_204222_c0_seq1.p1 gnl/TRDRNA2_/TRDRNA2_204222_c0~~gnl/TRDRNA2_/TRDRNA2_204222_c0_seq1.p1  ORF type:complete len:416 (-),score=55.22 gnl/TRDRNA2_/TRDRNA2_204222_c0_seq1:4-1251(-)
MPLCLAITPCLLVLLSFCTQPAGTCDLTPWLQTAGTADSGYHVLCVYTSASSTVEVHPGGVALARRGVGTSPGSGLDVLPFELALDESFVEQLEERLQIRHDIAFLNSSRSAVAEDVQITFPKQHWAIFTSEGRQLEPGKEVVDIRSLAYEGVLLLFEGGVWRWPGIRLGYERPVLPGVILRTTSLAPALFEVVVKSGSFESNAGLDQELLDGVVNAAMPRMRPSKEYSGNSLRTSKARTSDQAWIKYESSEKLLRLRELTAEMLRMPVAHFDKSLQVLRYAKGQSFGAHLDARTPDGVTAKSRFVHKETGLWFTRHATLLWILRAAKQGGETWFPRAHAGPPLPDGEWFACDQRGAKLGGLNGTTALLFYSTYSNGEVDPFSLHAGCRVRAGEKWSANSWVWNQPKMLTRSMEL